MEVVGQSIVAVGVILWVVSELMLLTAVYHRGTILFIVCLLMPFALYAFAVVHIRKLWLPLTLAMAGMMVVFLGLRLAGCEYPMEEMFG